MAKQVEDILLRLGVQGFEGLERVKSSFRDLGKVTNLAERDVVNVRDRLREFATQAGNTEAANKGLIEAFKGLRSQVDMCGTAYAELTDDINRLTAASRGSTDAVERQRAALLNNARAGTQNAQAVQKQIAALERLQQQTRPGSSAFLQLGRDIEVATANLGRFKSEASAAASTLNQIPAVSLERIAGQIARLQRYMQTLNISSAEYLGFQQRIALISTAQERTTGRQRVRAQTAMFESPQYAQYVEGRAANLELPNTLAAIRLRISEINTELENITGYERRRDLTIELKSLNRQLKSAVLDVTTQEDLALQRLRARVNAQRELNQASGFLAFSRQAGGGEFDPAITKSIERARRKRGLLSPDQQTAIDETTAELERSLIEASNAIREASIRNTQLEIQALQRKNEEADRLNAELIASNKRVTDAEVAAFDRLLAARDRYATSKGFTKQFLGLSGQELSPFYQQVVEMGVGTAGTQASKYQKRDFQRVLTDTIDAFNLQLTESGRTAVEGMGYFKEAAIAHAGGSDKVRRVLDRWDAASIPSNMFPFAGEQGDAYRRRIEEGSNIFKQVVEAFKNTLNRSSKTLSTSADQIRDSAISFASQAGRGQEVRTALGRFGAAGNVPTFMLPGTGESPEAYSARITGPAPLQIPQLGDVRQSSLRKLMDMQQLLQEIRADVPPIGKEFANLDRQITQSINKIDREVRRRQGGGRLSGMQLAQGVGAALSGGIFGGPEGLIGGLGGLALGGVGGAFAGAAAGAQLGMFRQQIGGTATYAAEIQKLQIALRGIVGSQDAYNRAIAAAAAATRDLNIPQAEATRGLTRLSAAVIGAGGTVNDSAFAFRAMSEAIKATGGSAEQVDGALLALTQVFSKGKVSAEELNQIAERLPGTFTLFAQATGKSGPALQKALQEGEVGLRDLMAFLQLLSNRYSDTALTIAKSSQDAGARLAVAFQQMRLEVGTALQPIGAELQTAFADFVTSVTPAVVGSIKAITAAFSFFKDNTYIASIGEFALKLGLVTAAGVALRGTLTALTSLNLAAWFAGATASAKITGDVMATTAVKAGGLMGTLTTLGAILTRFAALAAITITVDVLIKNFTQLMAAKEALDKIRKQRDPVGEFGPRLVMTAERRYTGASREKVVQDIEVQRNAVSRLRKELARLEYEQSGYLPTNFRYGTLQAQIELRKEQIKAAEEVIGLDVKRFKTRAQIEKEYMEGVRRRFATPEQKDADKKAADKEARNAQIAADQKQRLAEAYLQQQLRIADAVFKHQVALDRQRYELQKQLSELEAQNRLGALTGVEREAAAALLSRQQQTEGFLRQQKELQQSVEQARQKLFGAQQTAALTRVGTAAAKPGLPSGMANYISGDPRSPFYRADHGGRNYHEHVSFVSRKAAEEAYNKLIKAGIKVTEFKGFSSVGRHTPGSAHYRGLAFDVPGAQVPVGSEAKLTARVKSLLGVGKLPAGVAAQQRRNVKAEGAAGVEEADLAAAIAQLTQFNTFLQRFETAATEQYVQTLTKSFTEQTQELKKTAKAEQELQALRMQGYSPERVAYEQSLNLALDQRNKTLKQVPLVLSEAPEIIDRINSSYQSYIKTLGDAYNAQEKFNSSAGAGFRIGASQYLESLGTMNEAVARLTTQGFKGLEDAIVELTTTGSTNFAAFAAAIMRDTARMIIQQLVMKSIVRMIGNAFGFSGFADGGVFGMGGAPNYSAAFGGAGTWGGPQVYAMGGVFGGIENKRNRERFVPYAMGGIVTRPTFFRFADGAQMSTGLMGEAGPEAIMPLRRLPSGRLGVESSTGTAAGAMTNNITVNVDASGTSTQGDPGRGERLARAVSQAVQDELIKQRRPGGILADVKSF